MDEKSKAYNLFWQIFNENKEFRDSFEKNYFAGKIRFFNDEEWDKIKMQNFISPITEMREFIDMFILGYNIGNCVGASMQLSYSYDDVDIVSGILPMIKGTLNAEKEGGHCWLETDTSIIDTSFMLVIDKSLKEGFGYIEEQRLTQYQLENDKYYQARKKFVTDSTINKGMR